jgi:penicillin-binding protein 1A
LKSIPIEERTVPEGIISVGDDYYYAENPPGTGVHSLEGGAAPGAPAEEKAKDAVKNELF